ncbi:MAG: hypothetical protein PHW62_00295 [Candidatus Ratteibacteria bacterium]|nr:hypothetical protein [Candidatus Ratteibacteria bacterium]
MKGWYRITAYAQCTQCDWDFADKFGDNHTHNMGKMAQAHADKTGHTVNCEIGFTTTKTKRN